MSKHVALISELSRLVETHSLMDVSQLEQELACHDDGTTQRREVLARIGDGRIGGEDKLRLALLYALRYEQTGNVEGLKLALAEHRVAPDRVSLVDALLRYGGRSTRTAGLFGGDTSLLAKFSKQVKSSLEGIENVYAQHVPLLLETLDLVSKNRLPEARYPCVTGAAVQALRPAEVVVYIAGGATYEEATKVAELNASGGVQVVLGGSYVHNSGTFLEDLDGRAGRGVMNLFLVPGFSSTVRDGRHHRVAFLPTARSRRKGKMPQRHAATRRRGCPSRLGARVISPGRPRDPRIRGQSDLFWAKNQTHHPPPRSPPHAPRAPHPAPNPHKQTTPHKPHTRAPRPPTWPLATKAARRMPRVDLTLAMISIAGLLFRGVGAFMFP